MGCEDAVVFRYFSLLFILRVICSKNMELVRALYNSYFNVKRVRKTHKHKNTGREYFEGKMTSASNKRDGGRTGVNI